MDVKTRLLPPFCSKQFIYYMAILSLRHEFFRFSTACSQTRSFPIQQHSDFALTSIRTTSAVACWGTSFWPRSVPPGWAVHNPLPLRRGYPYSSSSAGPCVSTQVVLSKVWTMTRREDLKTAAKRVDERCKTRHVRPPQHNKLRCGGF